MNALDFFHKQTLGLSTSQDGIPCMVFLNTLFTLCLISGFYDTDSFNDKSMTSSQLMNGEESPDSKPMPIDDSAPSSPPTLEADPPPALQILLGQCSLRTLDIHCPFSLQWILEEAGCLPLGKMLFLPGSEDLKRPGPCVNAYCRMQDKNASDAWNSLSFWLFLNSTCQPIMAFSLWFQIISSAKCCSSCSTCSRRSIIAKWNKTSTCKRSGAILFQFDFTLSPFPLNAIRRGTLTWRPRSHILSSRSRTCRKTAWATSSIGWMSWACRLTLQLTSFAKPKR